MDDPLKGKVIENIEFIPAIIKSWPEGGTPDIISIRFQDGEWLRVYIEKIYKMDFSDALQKKYDKNKPKEDDRLRKSP